MNTTAPWARWARVGVAATLLGVQLDGCATTGGPRSITQPPSSDPAASEQLRLTSISSGTMMRVVLRTDSIVSGKYQGVTLMPPEAYARRVAEFREARKDTTPLPEPGTKITVRRKSKDREAFLDGFGYRSLELRWKEASDPQLLPFDDFESITDAKGHRWTRDALWFEARSGRLPCVSELMIDTDDGTRLIPLDQITDVAYKGPGGQWIAATLILVGLVVLVVAIVSASQKPQDTGCDYNGPVPTFMLQRPGQRALPGYQPAQPPRGAPAGR